LAIICTCIPEHGGVAISALQRARDRLLKRPHATKDVRRIAPFSDGREEGLLEVMLNKLSIKDGTLAQQPG